MKPTVSNHTDRRPQGRAFAVHVLLALNAVGQYNTKSFSISRTAWEGSAM